MKADFQDQPATVPPSAANGTHRVRKPSAPRRSTASVPEPPAAFATAEETAVDAVMWPLHSANWFQPERAPSAPQWSGLGVERQSRLPGPGFARSGALPFDRSDTRKVAHHVVAPDTRPAIPQSDLAPLGWDPRAICRKEERE